MADENSLWRDRNKVFVAGIPAHADDAALYEKFRKFGEMHQSKVVYDARTGKSKGFGFLTFASYEHALEAVDNMNQSKWENRVLNVRFLQPKSGGDATGDAAGAPAATAAARQRPAKIFPPCPEGCVSVYVGNLAYGITEPVLRKVFAGCGDIKAVRFAEHIETKEFRGFGYVQFYDGAACEKAVRLDGMIVMGRPMNLDYGARDEATEKAREDLTRKLKKGVCHRFQSGECPRGEDCKFAHVLSAQDADRVLHSEPTSAVVAAAPVVPAFSASASVPAPADGPPICESFLKGKCKRGDKCKFQHVEASAAVLAPEAAAPAPTPVAEFRSRYSPSTQEDETPVCQSFLKGKCKRGDKCKFRHEEEQEGDAASTPTAVENLYYESRAPQEEDAVDDSATVCQSFLKGKCKRGDKCKFRHVDPATAPAATPAPARVPTPVRAPVPVRGPTSSHTAAAAVSDVPVCLNFQKGTCMRGDACRFRHVAATEAPPVPVAAVAAPAAADAPAVHVTAAAEDAPICQSFLQGRCKRGDKCRFRHVDAADVPALATPEVVPTISICKNFTRGRCARGTSCRFAHTEGDVADAAAAREAAAVVAAAAVTTAHSDYQKRFQSVCYNWQNARSCVRGDACPFFHDGATAPRRADGKVDVKVEIKTEKHEEMEVAIKQEKHEEMEVEIKKEKKEKKIKKEKKEKKEKKRKADDSDDSDNDDDKKKNKKKKSKRSESD